jgi:hypothetical protein
MRHSQPSRGHLAVSLVSFFVPRKSRLTAQRKMPHTFRFVHILPAVRSTQHVFGTLGLHVLALVVAAIEDHLVGTCAAFESVFAGMDLV